MTTAALPGARSQALGVMFCLLASVGWGTTGTAATFAPDVPAMAIGAAAMGFGGLLQALIAVRALRAERHLLHRNSLLILVGGLAVATYPLAFYSSMRLAGVTIGTVISLGAAPLMAALIENRLEGSRLTRRWAIGAFIGLIGMGLLSLAEDKGHAVAASNVPLGSVLGLIAAGSYAVYSWTARTMMQRGVRTKAAMGATFGLGGLFLMPVLLMTGSAFLDSTTNFAVGAYMALVPMFLGYVAFGYALASIPTRLATTLTLFEPVVAALLAVVVVGERLPLIGWTGAVLIIICLCWMTLPVPRGFFRRPA